MPDPIDPTHVDSGGIATSSSDSLRPGSGSQSSAPNEQVELPYPEELQAMLGGAYVIESFLGQGGMGAVYKGLQMPLRRPVAVKILAKGVGEDYGFEERFKREAYAMAALTHPHIVQVYDCGDAGEQFLFISMELVEGGDLSDALKAQQVTPEMALKLMPQICDGLQAAHERGIVHRDIKPANIFLTADGRAKVADFGLAKKFSGAATMVTKTGLGLGTPDYAAPEQYENLPDIDHRADIYSLGVMFYQLLTGRLPRGAWKPPSSRAGTDPRLDDVVLKAMESDREERYQTVEQFKQDILRITTQAQAQTVSRAVPVQPMNTAAVPVTRPASSPLPGATGAVPARSGPMMARPTGAVSSQRTGAVPTRPTGAVPAGRQSGGMPVAVRPTGRATPASQSAPPPRQGLSVNLIVGSLLAVAVLALAGWAWLKPGGGRSGGVVELLDPNHLDGQAIRGIWMRTPDGIHGKTDGSPSLTDDNRHPVYELPYAPPEEYDFEVEFTRVSGNVSLILSAGGATFAHQFATGSDEARPARAGLTRLDKDGIGRPNREATVDVMNPSKGQRHVAVVQVRRGSIRSTMDGAEVLNWSGDFSRLSSAPSLSLNHESLLGIGSSSGEIIYHRATVREVSGPGRKFDPGKMSTPGYAKGPITREELNAVLEWALALKGAFVVVQHRGIGTKITKMEEVPAQFDRIVEVELPGGTRPKSPVPPGVFKTLVASPGMRRFLPRQSELSTQDINTLVAAMPELRSLNLDANKFDDGIIDSIARLKWLEGLQIGYRKEFTGRGLEKLVDLPRLSSLYLVDLSIGDEAMKAVGEMTGLKALGIQNAKVTDAGVASLKDLTLLEDFRFKGTEITPRGLQALRQCTKLRHIEMTLGRGVNDLGEFAKLATVFPNLQELMFDTRGPKEAEVHAQLSRAGELATFPALRRLEFWGTNSLSASVIGGLDRLPKLEHVQIDYAFKDEDVALLKGVKLLRILRLGSARFSEAGAFNLSALGVLQEIGKVSFTEAGLKAFKQYRPDVRIIE